MRSSPSYEICKQKSSYRSVLFIRSTSLSHQPRDWFFRESFNTRAKTQEIHKTSWAGFQIGLWKQKKTASPKLFNVKMDPNSPQNKSICTIRFDPSSYTPPEPTDGSKSNEGTRYLPLYFCHWEKWAVSSRKNKDTKTPNPQNRRAWCLQVIHK